MAIHEMDNPITTAEVVSLSAFRDRRAGGSAAPTTAASVSDPHQVLQPSVLRAMGRRPSNLVTSSVVQALRGTAAPAMSEVERPSVASLLLQGARAEAAAPVLVRRVA